jgi:hypothetical protein
MSINKASLALFKTARNTLDHNPDPISMSELDRLNISASLEDPGTALLLAVLRCYTSDQWWAFADIATDPKIQDLSHIWAVLASCYSDDIEPEDALSAEHALIHDLAHRDIHDESPAVMVSRVLYEALSIPGESGPHRALSIATAAVVDEAGDLLVKEGIITKGELLDLEIESTLTDGDLDGDIVSAALGDTDDDDDGLVPISQHVIDLEGNKPLDPQELEAHRYIYQCAYSSMSEIIAAYTFNPDTAFEDYAEKLDELAADFAVSELSLISILHTLNPPVELLVELAYRTDPKLCSHTSLVAAAHILHNAAYAHAFDEEQDPVNFNSPEEAEAFFETLEPISALLKESANSMTGDTDGSLTTFLEHVIAAQSLDFLIHSTPEDSEQNARAHACLAFLLNPFNATTCSRLALWNIVTPESECGNPQSSLRQSMGICARIIADADDDFARQIEILKDEPEDGGFV